MKKFPWVHRKSNPLTKSSPIKNLSLKLRWRTRWVRGLEMHFERDDWFETVRSQQGFRKLLKFDTRAKSVALPDFMGYCSRGIVLNDIVLEKLKNIFNSTANIAEGLNRHGVWTWRMRITHAIVFSHQILSEREVMGLDSTAGNIKSICLGSYSVFTSNFFDIKQLTLIHSLNIKGFHP